MNLSDLVATIDPEYLRRQRWFGSKSKPISRLRLADHAVLQTDVPIFILALIEVEYRGFDPELYSIPLMITDRPIPQLDLLREPTESTGFVYEALANDAFCTLLLQHIGLERTISASAGRFVFEKTPAFVQPESLAVKRSRAEQSNTSIIFGGVLIMKSFRKIAAGINPDVETSRFLTTQTDFRHIPLLAGTIEYVDAHAGAAIALLQRFVPNHGDAWDYTQRQLEEFYATAVRSAETSTPEKRVPAATPDSLMRQYAADAKRLGRITGQLHRALASHPKDPVFTPEPITKHDVEQWITAIQHHIETTLHALEHNLSLVGPALEVTARELVRKKPDYLKKVEGLRGLEDSKTHKIRCHGDYHLGQVLKTDDGFCILDFEGEPLRPLQERREKASPLKDVAGMLRSYHYAAHTGLFAVGSREGQKPGVLESWARAWERQASQSFLDGYLEEIRRAQAALVPSTMELLMRTLSVFLLDKAIYELHYELNHRPSWVRIPMEGIQVAMELREL